MSDSKTNAQIQLENVDLSSRLEPIQAHSLKNGHYVLDDNTGMPGLISDLKMSKTGKHGHAKFTYKLEMPFTKKHSSPMHPGGDRLLRPIMSKVEYEVMDYEGDILVVLKDDEEHNLTLLRDSELGQKVADAFDDGKFVVVTVQEGPQRIPKKGSKGEAVEGKDILWEMPTSMKIAD